MYNDLFTIGGLTVHGYGLMIGIGFVAAIVLAMRRVKKKGLSDDALWGLALWCIVGGIVGAKLFHIISIWGDVVRNPRILLDFANGFVLYGGVVGGVLTGYIYARVKKLNFWKYFDLVMPSVAVAQGFGRIGCFLAGCCHGMETDSWFSVTFHNSPFAPNGVPLVPTQLISSAGDFLIAIILILIARRQKFDGQVAGMYCVLYGVGRFFIEYARADARSFVGIFTIAQFIALLIVAIGIGLMIWRQRVQNRPVPQPQA